MIEQFVLIYDKISRNISEPIISPSKEWKTLRNYIYQIYRRTDSDGFEGFIRK